MDATRGRASEGAWWRLTGAVDRRQTRRDIVFLTLGLAGLTWLALSTPFRKIGLEWVFLAVLALISDWIPVPLSEHLRLRFVAPFLVAVAVQVGPTAAVITDLAALTAAMFGAKVISVSSPQAAAVSAAKSVITAAVGPT